MEIYHFIIKHLILKEKKEIQKNSDFKLKINTAFKLLTQIDQGYNKIFEDFIIFDTTDTKQINSFYNLSEMIFSYTLIS